MFKTHLGLWITGLGLGLDLVGLDLEGKAVASGFQTGSVETKDVQKVEPAEPASLPVARVDWHQGVLWAQGTGWPSLRPASLKQARQQAYQAAQVDVASHMLEALAQMRLSGQTQLQELWTRQDDLKAQLEAVVKNRTLLKTTYFAEGQVVLTASLPLVGALTDLAVRSEASPALAAQPPVPIFKAQEAALETGHTGVVVNAQGLHVVPALAPHIWDEAGRLVYGASFLSSETLHRQGVVGYAFSLSDALREGRVADRPWVMRPLRAQVPHSSDVVVRHADATFLTHMAPLLSQARVVWVVDAPSF